MIERIEGRADILKGAVLLNETVDARRLQKLRDVHRMASTILTSGDYKNLLDKERLNYLWQDNKVLRQIYATQLPADASQMTFDDFVNPPYGWEKALEDWN